MIGRKRIDDEIYYYVDWAPTWEPESELDVVEELIDEYLTTLKHTKGVRNCSGGEPQKRCGRPRKQ